MPTWTDNELGRIGDAQEMRIAAMRPDGSLRTPVVVWVVRNGDDLYTRSVNGPDAAWFRGTRAHREGRISAGGVDADVTFIDADDEVDGRINDAIDAAYHRKYGRYPGPVASITSPLARSTTIRIVPAQPSELKRREE
jgi:hypothetical protein